MSSGFTYKSFRHSGAKDTDKDALSLYANSFYGGEEVHVEDATLLTELPIPIKSIGYTGNSSWTLYEGKGFTGHKICLPGAGWGKIEGWGASDDLELNLKISNIRSLSKGCTTLTRRVLSLGILKGNGKYILNF